MSNENAATVEQTTEELQETQPVANSEVATSPETELDSTPTTEASPEEVSSPAAEDEADESALSIHKLRPGQHFDGKVKNVTDFGAFVDIGLPQDGLVHISEISKQKVEKVSDAVNVGDEIDVWVKKVDKKRGRISLTMIKPISLKIKDINEGDELGGVVTRLEPYGAFVDIDSERDGLVHISQITHEYIKHPEDVLKPGDTVQVKVLKVNPKKRQIDLSIKMLLPPPVREEMVPEVVEEVVELPPEAEMEDEPAQTAMAIALAAAMENRRQSDKSAKTGGSRDKRKRKKELDEIINRTLATRD